MKTTTETGNGWTRTITKGWFYESSRTRINHKTPEIRPQINVRVDKRQLHLHARPERPEPAAESPRPLLRMPFIDVQPA